MSFYKDSLEAPKNKLIVPGRIKEAATGSITIFVFANGLPNDQPARITFPLKNLDKWSVIINEINQRMKQKGKDAKDLYTLDGRKLSNSFDLEQGGQYVAVGYGVRGFVKSNYGEAIKPSFYVPINRDITRKDVWNSKKMDKWRNRHGVSLSTPASSDLHSFSSNSEVSDSFKRISKNKYYHNSDGNFHAKHRNKNIRNVNYDEDASGLFKAKKQRDETKHALSIKEDVQTKIELPAEMVPLDDDIEFVEERDEKSNGLDSTRYYENSTYRKSYK